jgi:hypothetical protein
VSAKKTKTTQPLTLTKTKMVAGIWEGVLTNAGSTEPVLTVRHQDILVDGITVTESPDAGTWFVQVPVPPALIADGVQTFVISDDATGETLGSFALFAGEGLAEDIRAEMDLLRAELDMMKRAFRRHCNETQ